MQRRTIHAGALVAAALAVAAPDATAASRPLSGAAAVQHSFVSVFRRVSPSVVQIETGAGLGSGLVFDTKGDIVTNDHVVGTARTFTVTIDSGRQLQGTLVGRFALDDLAVIHVPPAGLRPVRLADSSRLQVGDLTMAIGNPLGLSSSVTEGIVSALQRSETEENGNTLPDTIQTSAPINPGNSGGALVDLAGRVIGIPTLAASDPELGGGAAAGIGFAIPSNVVRDIAGQLIRNGRVVDSHRPYLGISIADARGGAYVGRVKAGSPAASGGLKAGDVITAVDGHPTPTAAALESRIGAFRPGQTLTLQVRRQGQAVTTVHATLGQFPAS